MQHRISAGALVEYENRILLVRHEIPGKYNFWVAPGGGVQGTESLQNAAERETYEETGLQVHADRLLYVEEFHQPGLRHCKFWFHATLAGGTLDASNPLATVEHIKEAAWLSPDERVKFIVFPSFLQSPDWTLPSKDHGPVHLGLRAMELW